MRRFFLSLLVCLIAAGAARAQSPDIPGLNSAPPGPQPKAQVENPLFDFGTALEGTMVNHTFMIKNTGKGELMIRGIKTSCGCTAAVPSKNHLAPGEEASVDVGFDTHFQKGHQIRTITAFTNDPDVPQAVMTMQGIVKQQVAATPAQVSFGTVRKGTEITRDVTIDDLTGRKGFSVGPVSNSNSAIKVVQAPRTDHQPGALLHVTLEKTMPPGAFDDTIKVVTNRVPIQVDVFGTVSGDLSVEPAQVSFGIAPRGQDVVRLLALKNNGPRQVKVLDVTSSVPTVGVSTATVTPGKEYKITVTLNRGAPEGQLRGQLTIKTDDPDDPSVTVPFYAIVGQPRL
ncbi:MAG TPA: DUF1573 domain-containing protein [Candidatus Binataceae bacterium]|nr:DUF1573 domain-containing protein [Candidatus Binataceae bacterium]